MKNVIVIIIILIVLVVGLINPFYCMPVDSSSREDPETKDPMSWKEDIRDGVCISPYIDMENHKCGYRGRSKLAAFLFSLFLGFLGMDWFYLSFGTATYTVAGIFKIIVLLRRKMTAIDDLCYILPGYLLCIFPVIWYLGDLIRILGDSFPDGNGMPLFQDM